MPKLFEYLGIILYFWSKEHEPIHVHGDYQGNESKAELHIENGKITEIIIKKVKGRRPLDQAELKNFETIVNYKADEIIQKWIDYFVLHKKVTCEKITRRVS